jgi:16S rRNA processing protein RimM
VLVGADEQQMRTFGISKTRNSGRHLLVAFDGVDDREAAAGLSGQRIMIPRQELPALDEDEVYVDDLIGLEVRCDGRPIGRVSGSREQGGAEVLIVTTGDEELQVPLVEQYVVAVDVGQGRVEVREIDELPRAPLSGSRRKGGD